MPSDGLCFICTQPMDAADTSSKSIEFAGDYTDERGRYAVHLPCLQPQWRRKWVTRKDMELPEPQKPSFMQRFFRWGMRRFG